MVDQMAELYGMCMIAVAFSDRAAHMIEAAISGCTTIDGGKFSQQRSNLKFLDQTVSYNEHTDTRRNEAGHQITVAISFIATTRMLDDSNRFSDYQLKKERNESKFEEIIKDCEEVCVCVCACM